MSTPLLTTKLQLPPRAQALVARSRLVDRLAAGLHPGCRLTLVSAPAGFGKTTLLSAWARAASATDPYPGLAWLSLDAGDNDPVVFWSYLIAALQTQHTGLGAGTLPLLAEAAPGLGWESKLSPLLNDLSQAERPLVLVLDDFHLIRSPALQQSLEFFLDHLPAGFHLVIASRTDPPLPLALLRGRGQLLEVRLNDLRFSDQDAGAYLQASLGLDLAAPLVQALNHKTEGWIAGLQMAALSLRAAPGPLDPGRVARFVDDFSGSDRFILDYLLEEVLAGQPAPVQDFLLRTSILERLCAPLCQALFSNPNGADGLADGQALLEGLEKANLFIQPLDQQRGWYRYHQLFADLLRKRLEQTDPGAAAGLHRRAMEWYQQYGDLPSAIRHAFQAKDLRNAACLVAQIAEETWGRGEHATLQAWVDALPQAEIAPYPHLWVFQVSMYISAGRWQDAARYIPAIEETIRVSLADPAPPAALLGNAFALRTYIASFQDDQAALFEHARAALAHLAREEDAGQRCGVSLVLGHAYLVAGALADAARALDAAVVDGRKAHKPHMALTGLANLARVASLQGDWSRAAQVCQEGLALVEEIGLERSPMAADLWIAWGETLHAGGRLEEAGEEIARGLAAARQQHYVWPMAWGALAQGRLLASRGDLAGALAGLEEVEQLARRHAIPDDLVCAAAALRAEVYLRQ
ncbi:MAG: AAA family ATPase, partial [Chloroflexi bacterium]|nr:AAA family ATPase [Chloroflexota bacterium]